MSEAVLEVRELVKHYPLKRHNFGRRAVVHALDGVSFSLAKGETTAVVGESGCGKSTLAKCVMRLTEPTSGTIRLAGRDITLVRRRELRASRRAMQIVFQNPYASLNPRRSVHQAIADPLRLHDICPRRERRGLVAKLLQDVGLGAEFQDRYPHELSGGQQQRVAIARALAVRPQVIICDEPVSALDVSVQAQVINLLLRLQERFGLSYLFISHNLALARRFADRVAVMYLGQIVEFADRGALQSGLLHPYSRALFQAMPVADPERAGECALPLSGEPPSPVDPPAGCRFQSRCPHRQEVCAAEAPALRTVEGRLVRCHFAEAFRAGEELAPRTVVVAQGEVRAEPA